MPVTITQSHIRVAQRLADTYECKAEIRVCRENETMAGGRVIVSRPSESRWVHGCYTVTIATLDPMGNLHIEYPDQVIVEPA